tara:strand:- start:231 stop:449 length:219 start_codon:yes stop_codon:yes gene_type:complete
VVVEVVQYLVQILVALVVLAEEELVVVPHQEHQGTLEELQVIRVLVAVAAVVDLLAAITEDPVFFLLHTQPN